jgi:hypothetical protein
MNIIGNHNHGIIGAGVSLVGGEKGYVTEERTIIVWDKATTRTTMDIESPKAKSSSMLT